MEGSCFLATMLVPKLYGICYNFCRQCFVKEIDLAALLEEKQRTGGFKSDVNGSIQCTVSFGVVCKS